MCKRLPIAKKLEILQLLEEPKATQRSVATALGVSRKTVQNAITNRELINRHVSMGSSLKRCHLKIDQKFQEINEATFQWFMELREERGDVPIVERVIRNRAIYFARVLQVPEFKASKGWFRSWKNRYGLNPSKIWEQQVIDKTKSIEACEEENAKDDTDETQPPPVSVEDAKNALKTLTLFALTQPNFSAELLKLTIELNTIFLKHFNETPETVKVEPT